MHYSYQCSQQRSLELNILPRTLRKLINLTVCPMGKTIAPQTCNMHANIIFYWWKPNTESQNPRSKESYLSSNVVFCFKLFISNFCIRVGGLRNKSPRVEEHRGLNGGGRFGVCFCIPLQVYGNAKPAYSRSSQIHPLMNSE